MNQIIRNRIWRPKPPHDILAELSTSFAHGGLHMAEIFEAYKSLNRTLNLGLSPQQILAAEAQFKLDFSDRMKFPASLTKDPMALSAEWEFVGTLTPRRRALTSRTTKSLEQLKKEVAG
jgi:hypothetical protein